MAKARLHHDLADERPEDPGDSSAGDAAWVEGIRGGDAAAFEALYREYWQRLYAFAFRYMHSKEDAEEVVQDVFLRVWRGRSGFSPAGSVGSYLYVAVRNAALDRFDRAATARRWRDRQLQALRADLPHEISVPGAHLAAADFNASVERALAELPSRRRAVCALRLIDRLSYGQIAERLGIAPKTVETQLARGLRFLRSRLRDFEQ